MRGVLPPCHLCLYILMSKYMRLCGGGGERGAEGGGCRTVSHKRWCMHIFLPFSFPILGLLYQRKFVTLLLAHTRNSQSDFNNTFVRSLYTFICSHQARHPARHFSWGHQSSYSLLLKSSPCKYLSCYITDVYRRPFTSVYTWIRDVTWHYQKFRVHSLYKPISATVLALHVNMYIQTLCYFYLI